MQSTPTPTPTPTQVIRPDASASIFQEASVYWQAKALHLQSTLLDAIDRIKAQDAEIERLKLLVRPTTPPDSQV